MIAINASEQRIGDLLYCVDLKSTLNSSCGIQAQHLVNLAQSQGLNLNYASSPVSSTEIAKRQALKGKADFILDIYGLFTELGKLKKTGRWFGTTPWTTCTIAFAVEIKWSMKVN